MKSMFAAVTAVGLGLVIAFSSVAQNAQEGQKAREQQTENQRKVEQVWRASNLTDWYVRNAKGDTLGHIEDMVVNLRTGEVVYAVLTHGEVLGFGGKMFAIDPSALTIGPKRDHFVMQAQPADFENGKGFDANSWPTKADPRWRREGANKTEEGREEIRRDEKNVREQPKDKDVDETQRLARITSITGMDVHGRNNEDLGDVYDLAVAWNDDQHRIVYAAVSYGTTLGVGGKLIPVPWDALQFRAPTLERNQQVLHLDAIESDMQAAPGFDNNNWPATPNMKFGAAQRNKTSTNNNR